MEGTTVFTPSLEGMKHVKSENGEMLTKPFLDVCKLILPVLDKFGAAMALVKSDVGGNITVKTPLSDNDKSKFTVTFTRYMICSPPQRFYYFFFLHLICSYLCLLIFLTQRLENNYISNPSKYELLYSMVQEEIEAKTATGSSSCTNGILWLTRAMDFLVELFRNLLVHPDWTMSEACSDSYGKTLKKWHGWLASSSFSVAMKFAPDRKKFMEVIGGSGDVNADMEKFCATFAPLLAENHKFLASVGLDDLKAS